MQAPARFEVTPAAGTNESLCAPVSEYAFVTGNRRSERANQSHSESDRNRDTDDRVAILFDMDGVLLEGRSADPVVHSLALEDLLADRGLNVDDSGRTALSEYAYTDAFVDACAAIDVDPVSFYTAREERSAAHIIDRIADGARGVYDDVDALDRLPDRAAVGVVSNNYHPAVTFVVERFGLNVFEFVRGRDFGPEGFSRRKPDPYYLNEALDALEASGGLYVGDRETDVRAAERAGIDSVFLRREHNADVALDVDPTAEVDGLDAVVDVAAEVVG